MTLATLLAAAWGLYWALSMLCGGDDLLRLRPMIRLAAAFALVGAPPVLGLCFASGLALAACRIHPDLRLRPLGPLLLIMLTPAASAGAASYAIGLGAFTPPLRMMDWLHPNIQIAAAAALLAAPAFGLSWRVRLLALAMAGVLATAAAAQLLGADPVSWMVLAVPVFAAAARAEVWREAQRIPNLWKPVALGLCIPGLTLAAQAGPWTQKTGDELLILRAPVSARASVDQALSLQSYAEKGLTDDVTVVTTAYQEIAGRSTKTGAMVGVRSELWQDDDWIVSGEIGVGVEPLSFSDSGDWRRHAQAELKLLAGWSGSLDDMPVYVAADAGWRFRPETFGDAAVLGISAGLDLAPDLQFNVHASTTIETAGSDTQFAQAGLLWRIDDWIGLEAGVQGFATDGEAFETQATAGVWLRF